MNFYKISITASSEKQGLIIAFLSNSGFDGFEEEEFSIKTYIKEEDYKEDIIKDLADQLDFTFKTRLIPNQNWNALWEASFKPIQIKDFCAVRANFHETIPSVKHEIIINPKMAFGTGHHETTYLMMEMMEQVFFKNKEVLDYGCGTGILAILANKLGATHIQAIDNDPLSYENTLENATINQTTDIQAALGDISIVNGSQFDVILANINRNVIIQSLPTLYSKTVNGGYNLLSGILQTDERLVTDHVEEAGFKILETLYKGEWICMKIQK